jgi:hypothetical protein
LIKSIPSPAGMFWFDFFFFFLINCFSDEIASNMFIYL